MNKWSNEGLNFSADDFFVFNGIKSTSKDMVLIDYERIFLPLSKSTFIDIPGMDGSRYVEKKEKNDIFLRCKVGLLNEESDGTTLSEKILEKNDWLKGQGKLEFWDLPGMYYIGVLTEVLHVVNNGWGEFDLVFRCKPYKQTDETATSDISKKVVVYGTEKTKGTIFADVTNTNNHIEIKLKSTGEFLRIEDSFTAGDKIVIDLEEEYITKNGYSAMKYLTLESDFFSLHPGANEFILSNIAGSIEFRERWI